MKRAFYLLALLATGCQQQNQAAKQAPSAPPTGTRVAAVAAEPAAALPTDSLAPAMRATLQQVDLSPLLLAPQPGFSMALDGFFGTNPQRLSLAILQASRDSLRPEIIHVVGKARRQKKVTDFTGEIRLTRLADYFDQGMLLSQGEDGFRIVVRDSATMDAKVTNARAYAASASFRFIGSVPAAYALTGKLLLDFWLMDNGTVGMMLAPGQGEVLKNAPTKGSGLVLSGNWSDTVGGSSLPFVVSENIFLLSPGLIKDFGVGDRNSQVNPKYAKLGWSTYWENDEWWADSPKPKLNL